MKKKNKIALASIIALSMVLATVIGVIMTTNVIIARAGRLYFVDFAEELTPGKATTFTVLNAKDYDVEIVARYSPDNFKYTVSDGITTKGYRFGLDDDVDVEEAFVIEKSGNTFAVTCKYHDVFVMLTELYQTSNILLVGESDVSFEMTVSSGNGQLTVRLNVDMLFTGEQGVYDGNFNVKLDKEQIILGI